MPYYATVRVIRLNAYNAAHPCLLNAVTMPSCNHLPNHVPPPSPTGISYETSAIFCLSIKLS